MYVKLHLKNGDTIAVRPGNATEDDNDSVIHSVIRVITQDSLAFAGWRYDDDTSFVVVDPENVGYVEIKSDV